jgi:hypothetical protein
LSITVQDTTNTPLQLSMDYDRDRASLFQTHKVIYLNPRVTEQDCKAKG